MTIIERLRVLADDLACDEEDAELIHAAIARIEAADEALLYRARSNWLTRDAYRDVAMKQDGPGALVREQEGKDA